MPYSTTKLNKKLKAKFKMECETYSQGQIVIFFGSELECYKLAYKLKTRENKVFYSEKLKCFGVSFPYFFTVEFSQKIS